MILFYISIYATRGILPAEFPILYFLIAMAWLLPLASPIAVYYDRQYVATHSDWKPSALYYLMVFPAVIVGDIIAIAYLYNRHKFIGKP